MVDDLANDCFQFYRSQGISYLRASRGNYDTIFIEWICTVKSALRRNLKSN